VAHSRKVSRPLLLDVFAGAGGLTLGAHLAGFRTSVAIELDPKLSFSFSDNFPQVRLLTANVRGMDPRLALEEAGHDPASLVGVIGGPPCQGFSEIGRRNPADPRNQLVGEFFRFVRILQPSFFFVENVPGILVNGFGAVLEKELLDIGRRYEILGPLEVQTASYGAATVRPRVVVVGYDPGRISGLAEGDLEGDSEPATVADAIRDLRTFGPPQADALGDVWRKRPPGSKRRRSDYAEAASEPPPEGLASVRVRLAHRRGLVSGFQPTVHTDGVVKRFSAVRPGERDKSSRFPRLRWDEPAPTLRAGTGPDKGSYQSVRPIHPDEDRVVTVREAARIQGFPDWFQFHPTKWHSFRMIGNSVSPYLARHILGAVRRRLT